MEDIIQHVIQYVVDHTYNLLIKIGIFVPKNYIKYSIIILYSAPLYQSLKRVYKYVSNTRIKMRARKDLHPYIDRNNINLATKYFIETKGQNISPSSELEPRYSQAFTAKDKLISKFLKAIEDKKIPFQHYLILADSGMGKTTFLINLYFAYNKVFFKRKFKILILPLIDPQIDEKLKSVENQESTVLLLDGFDEDSKAQEDFSTRIKDLTLKTNKFRKIFVTARTQFFPSESLEPSETEVYALSKSGYVRKEFKKIYISPFDDQDVRSYINKKFPKIKFWNRSKKRKAFKVINSSPDLMARPMLLSYIDDLIDEDAQSELLEAQAQQKILTSSNIYKVLINKWILRESYRIEMSLRKSFTENMYKFSIELALFFFQDRPYNLTINHDEIKPFAVRSSINLSLLELKGKSLLNRDAKGSYKFSHKSILEYFLAKHAIENEEFGEWIQYFTQIKSFDQAARFCEEMNYEKAMK